VEKKAMQTEEGEESRETSQGGGEERLKDTKMNTFVYTE
jgi:hypothetical protein